MFADVGNLHVLNDKGERFPSFTKSEKNFVVLPHGSSFKVQLKNPFQYENCYANVTIDGHRIGFWVLKPHAVISIERPFTVSKKFTFLRTALVREAEEIGKLQAQGIKLNEDQQLILSNTPLGSGIHENVMNGLVKVEYAPELYSVFIKSNGTLCMILAPTMTIADLKNKIQIKQGIPSSHQVLVYAGKTLNDAQTLIDFNVHNGSTLHLYLRLFGGGNLRPPELKLCDAGVALMDGSEDEQEIVQIITRITRKTTLPNVEAGATTLMGESSQKFYEVKFDGDMSRSTFEEVRMVANADEKPRNRNFFSRGLKAMALIFASSTSTGNNCK